MKKYIFKDGDAEETVNTPAENTTQSDAPEGRMPFDDSDDEQAFM